MDILEKGSLRDAGMMIHEPLISTLLLNVKLCLMSQYWRQSEVHVYMRQSIHCR